MRKWLGNLFLTWGFYLLGIGAPTAIDARSDDDDEDFPGMFSFDLASKTKIQPTAEEIVKVTDNILEGSVEDRVRKALLNRRREF